LNTEKYYPIFSDHADNFIDFAEIYLNKFMQNQLRSYIIMIKSLAFRIYIFNKDIKAYVFIVEIINL